MSNFIENEKTVAPADGLGADLVGDISDLLAAGRPGSHRICAFLSYSSEDNRGQRADTQEVIYRCWGDWLHDALKEFSIPAEFIGQINGRGELVPERIQPIFRGEQELAGEAGLSAEVRAALEQSTCLIVICSPRSAISRQVNEAVRYFKQLGRGKEVLPFVVAGVPNAGEAEQADGSQPDGSQEEECFVPALRHPVKPDGTLDTTRRAGRYMFVDARQGVDKREILANDDRNAEAELEMAKIQLIALVLGVGFNGLWWREQRRHFLDCAGAQQQAREAAEQAEAAWRQLEEAQRQTREAQNRVLETQNLPREVQGQIQEAQNQARAAQDEARETQRQLQEFQNKVRETQSQLEAARNRAQAAESKVLEAQQQAQAVRNHLEETRNQAGTAQNSQTAEIRSQAQDAQNKLREAESRAQELQNQAQSAQSQLEEARQQVREAQGKILEAQQQAQQAREQLEEVRNQARAVQSTQSQIEGQTEEGRNQAQAAQNKLREAEGRVQELQSQAQLTQSQLEEARQQVHEAQGKILEAQQQVREALNKVPQGQNRDRNARRLTRVFAVLAALALLAASMALRQRLAAERSRAMALDEAAGQFDLAQAGSGQEPIGEVLQKIAGAEQAENRRRSLDQLAAGIPQNQISDALQASAVILNDEQRSHFQKWLLMRLGWANPVAAMTSAGAMTGKIVDAEGLDDTGLYFQLAVLDNWMRTDLPGAFNWAGQLPDAVSRQRALDSIMRDPARAGQLRQAVAAMPGGEAQNAAITALLASWAPVEPEKAVDWLVAFPETDAQPEQVRYVIRVWAERDPAAAAKWLADLPAGTVGEGVTDAFLAGAVENHPVFAWQWAQAVTDETQRLKFQLQVARQWMKADPLAAGQWIGGRDLL
jgi:uncharacterized coiled-coil DUF342 family protein